MLRLADLHAGYGNTPVLRGVHLRVERGEIVSLLGRNGAGRTTLARAVMGLAERRGTVEFEGIDIAAWPTHRIARAGIGYVPETRDLFPTLTVEENLRLGFQRHRAGRWTVEDAWRWFPLLRERARTAAGVLSGGEQQMLALARTLMGDPRLLVVDEPTEGLAPQLVQQVGEFLRSLQQGGTAVLLIEQKLALALALSQRVYVLGRGQIVFTGTPEQLRENETVQREWLTV